MTMTQSAPARVAGTGADANQWKAEALQMVNWGGFHGHARMTFALAVTLLSGASGTGKSTLLDAYLALMMPSDTPFNGASNDATTGRARRAGTLGEVADDGVAGAGQDGCTGSVLIAMMSLHPRSRRCAGRSRSCAARRRSPPQPCLAPV